MFFVAFCVVQLLSLASGESGAASELSLVFLSGECEGKPSQPWEHSLEENAARIAAEDVAVCSGVNLPVRLTSAAAVSLFVFFKDVHPCMAFSCD